MDAREALRRLKAAGTAQNKKVYARHGVRGPMFGVSYANQGKLKRAIGTDDAVAEGLWASGNHDARVLATMVADPARSTTRRLESWAKELGDYVLTDAVSALAAASPSAKNLARKWTNHRAEWKSTAGWNVVTRLAMTDELTTAELTDYLKTIEAGIHASPNRTRYSMNNALIAIGSRGGDLQKKAVAIAERIGKVEVDHGETGCRTPDAASYIAKTVAHRKKKGKKALRKKA